MKVLLMGLCMLLAGHAQAQSIEDTTAWILGQTKINPPQLVYAITAGRMTSEVSMGPGAASMGARPVRKAIPISQVTRISYVRTDRYLSYSLSCASPCAFLAEQPAQKQPVFLLEFYSKVEPGFVTRMNKALLHLVSLHGGRAQVEEHQAAPEPF